MYVCICKNLTESQVREGLARQFLDDYCIETGAGSCCGSCKKMLDQIDMDMYQELIFNPTDLALAIVEGNPRAEIATKVQKISEIIADPDDPNLATIYGKALGVAYDEDNPPHLNLKK